MCPPGYIFSLKDHKSDIFYMKYVETIFSKRGTNFCRQRPTFWKCLGPTDPRFEKPCDITGED